MYLPESAISDRSSSKRAMISDELDTANLKFKKMKKELRPRTSFDSDYWEAATEYAVMGRSVSQLRLREAAFAHVEGHGSDAEFLESSKARALQETTKAWDVKEKVYKKRALELKATNKKRTLQRSFMQLFTSSPLGLNIKDAFAGRRDSSL